MVTSARPCSRGRGSMHPRSKCGCGGSTSGKLTTCAVLALVICVVWGSDSGRAGGVIRRANFIAPALRLPRPIITCRSSCSSSRPHTVWRLSMSVDAQEFGHVDRPGSRRQGLLSREGLLSRGFWGILGLATAGWGNKGQAANAVGVQESDLPSTSFKTKSGVRYYDVREGTGPTPKWGQVSIIQYEAYCRADPRGKLVLYDDTYSRGVPYLIKHGNGRVIRGLEEGLHTMKLGGLRRIVVPLSMGFTRAGLGPLPPNALRRKILVRELNKAEQNEPRGELVYDVELVSVYDDEADLGYYEDLTFDPEFVQKGLADSLQELRDRGIKVPSTKEFLTKPELFRRPDVDILPPNTS